MTNEPPRIELLRAVVEGKTLQLFNQCTNCFCDENDLTLLFKDLAVGNRWASWRIKPDSPAEVVTHMFVEPVPKLDNAFDKPNLKLTFDGETKALMKAEVL